MLILVQLQVIIAFDFQRSPNYYKKGDKVDLLVNKVESDHTQLPYPYYNLPFVCPKGRGSSAKAKSLSLGQILSGDRIWESDYKLEFGIDQPCLRLCNLVAKETGIGKAESLIKDGYVVHWLLDGLPGATTFVSSNKNNKYYAAGFPLGFVEDGVSYIYNHVMLVIRYHSDRKNKNKNTIVGFEVYPKSVSNEQCPGSSKDYKNFALNLKKNEKGEVFSQSTIIPYTYSVYWREDNSIDYDSRWDLYYENETTTNHKIHWISFINSIILLSLGSLIAGIVLLRVLKSDIEVNAVSSPLPTTNNENEKLSNSWKNLIDEVFQKPVFALPLTILVSSGVQIIVATLGVIVILVLNSNLIIGKSTSSTAFFNNHQGAFFSISLFFFITLGFVSSYTGIILHKIFNNNHINVSYTQKTCLIYSIFFSGFLPTLILTVVLILNFFVWAEASSYALPFGTILVLILLVLVVEIPLGVIGGYYGNLKKFDNRSLIGSYTGYSKNETKDKNKNFTPTPSKKKVSWLLNPVTSILIFGTVPFGIVYVELLFIFNSVWLEKTTFYYMYGFLLITSLILIIIIAESSIIATYISLAVYNNPNWQWLCFRVGSSIGWFIYGYSVYYFTLYLHIHDFVSVLFYFAYMALVCVVIGIGCGSVGVLTGLLFIKKIYSAIKLD